MSRASRMISKLDEAAVAGSDVKWLVPAMRNVLFQWTEWAQKKTAPHQLYQTRELVTALNNRFEKHGIKFVAKRINQPKQTLFVSGEDSHAGGTIIFVQDSYSPDALERTFAFNMREFVALATHEMTHRHQQIRMSQSLAKKGITHWSKEHPGLDTSNPGLSRPTEIQAHAVEAANRLKMKDHHEAIHIIVGYQRLNPQTYQKFLRQLTKAADMNGVPTHVINQAIRQARRM